MENYELIDQVTAVTGRFTPFSLVVRPGAPDFLGLPWEQSLSNWQSGRLVDVERGIHRHVVRCVDYDGRLYALKELPQRLADREYRLLRHLEGKSVPAVQAIGIVNRFRRMRAARLSPDWDSDAVLITRYVDFSLLYRSLFTQPQVVDLRDQLLGALTGLLVHLHRAGFFWGDCSLSNILFRRDAGGQPTWSSLKAERFTRSSATASAATTWRSPRRMWPGNSWTLPLLTLSPKTGTPSKPPARSRIATGNSGRT